MRILVAEDDPALGSFVRKGLEAEHYAVDVSADGEQARAMAGELDFDLVVLDLNLPRLDGVSILRFLRTRKPSMPILVLTGRTRVEDRVQCLDLGADDYLGKPFSFTELSARIRALMRRSHLPAESVLTVDDLKLDRVERRVERAGRRIELTSKEFALLEYLMRNAGRRITRAMIIEHVWNLSFDTCTNVVDVYVNYSTSQVDKRKVGQLAMAIEVGFFDSGSADIKSSSVPALSRIVSLLAPQPYRLRIEGHTDNVPIHNSRFASNWELSTGRATELVRVLITQYQFAPERLSAAGYAEYYPVASNTTAAGRAQNRRLDIVILRKLALPQSSSSGQGQPMEPSPNPN